MIQISLFHLFVPQILNYPNRQTAAPVTYSLYNSDRIDDKQLPCLTALPHTVAYPGILFVGGFQQIHLRTEDRENGDLGAVAP